ncbi:transporter substrate-binding domain-containing protein [Hathewaya histolytica]|uniref:transporter substrate-binding domain-containing protein n=1 Tax=Hathewaya histolytica TaxID=1498 RepID=UPI003B68090A
MRSKGKLSLLISVVIIGGIFLGACGNKKEAMKVDNSKNEKVIRVGTSGEYNPWNFMKDGKLQGFEIDIWNEIGKRTGKKVEFKVSKFSGLFGMLDTGKVDTVAHQMSINKEREEKYKFSSPYAYSYYDFGVKGDSDIKTISDLKGKKVAVWLGGNGEKSLKKANKDLNLGLEIVSYDGTPLEKEVENGRVDAFYQGAIKAKTAIRLGNLNCKLLNDPQAKKITIEVNAYPFPKKPEYDGLREEVSKAIEDMHKDGTLKNLSMKWFEVDTTVK